MMGARGFMSEVYCSRGETSDHSGRSAKSGDGSSMAVNCQGVV